VAGSEELKGVSGHLAPTEGIVKRGGGVAGLRLETLTAQNSREKEVAMWTKGTNERRLLSLTIAAAAMLVLGALLLRGDAAQGDRLDQDPKIYLPLIMKRYCSDWWRDDFSDPNSGWPVLDLGELKFEYLGGEYHVRINEPHWGAYLTTSPPVYATNFTLEVDGRSDLGIYGLLFGRRIEWENGLSHESYSFELGPGNYWAIYKWWDVLDSGYSSYITSGMNHLRIVRQGSQMKAYVNGHLLSTVTDSSFLGSREVGLTAHAGDTAPVDAYFDNFAVCPVDSAPGPGAPGMGKGIVLRKGTPPTIEFWPR